MNRNKQLFGTVAPPPPNKSLAKVPWSFTLDAGSLRHVKLNGVEAIRSIAFLVRDRDWGTLAPTIERETTTQTDSNLTISYTAIYKSGAAMLSVDVTICVTAESLSMSAHGLAHGGFETNRAGFTVLHPIDGVAGQPVLVGHSNGVVEHTHFPTLIEPWQPFMDIGSLTHTVGEQAVTCELLGDVFEMEDQRQWGDASFKTYNRPLALDWPYVIADGDELVQSVNLTFGKALETPPITTPHPAEPALFPEMAFVVTPDDARDLATSPSDLLHVNPQRVLCHFDMSLKEMDRQLLAFAAAQKACPHLAFDLELILTFDRTPQEELTRVAAKIDQSGFLPTSILVCPSVDRQSTPPGSEWPDCPPLNDIHSAAAETFPNVIRGGGMVSFFPEFNRKRPPLKTLDFVSHGLCPIVHAADDLAVMETLEAIPHITRSARAIFGHLPYRIGPATIAMRQNPYGTRTIPNPYGHRIPMAEDDPRHRGQFGAAYVIGLATALAAANIAVWTPAALYGPRGASPDWPISQALAVLSPLAGQPVREAKLENGLAYLSVGDTTITANLTPGTKGDLGPYDWRVRS